MKELRGFVEEKQPDTATSALDRSLRLRLLGGFELEDADGRTLVLPTRKVELLLAFLAMPAGRLHNREKLAALLWGDRDDEQARGSLRKALSALRTALGADAIRADREQVALAAGAVEIDADGLAAEADGSTSGFPTDHYGEFLEGRGAASNELSDWLTFERSRCRALAQTVLEKRALAQFSAGRPSEAVALAQRLLALDNLREESHRLLMRFYFELGERSQALAQFQACRVLLRQELDVEPSSETLRQAKRITADELIDAAKPQTDGPTAASSASALEVRGLSVAVLPFQSLGDSGQDFFADGLTEDLVTELSRQRDMIVIAPNSTRGFVGTGAAEAAARELDVRYILAGTMRHAAGRLRINVQLIDAAGNRCIWAERYDSPTEDLFTVQDEIVARIIANIDAEVRSGERERAARKHPENLDAWELFHRGLWHAYRFTPADMAEARRWLERAIQLAPDFALPYAGIAYVSFASVTWHFVDNVEQTLGEAMQFARKALERDDRNAFAHVVLGRILTLVGETGRALRHLEIAVELNPGFSQAYFGMAWALFWSGRPQEALDNADLALRLNPRDPMVSFFLTLKSCCHYWLGDYPQAEAMARRGAQLSDREAWSRLALAVALVAQDREADAQAAVREARAIDPKLTLASFATVVGRVPAEVREPMFLALGRAGLS